MTLFLLDLVIIVIIAVVIVTMVLLHRGIRDLSKAMHRAMWGD